jgi:hypothetical protein
MWKVIIAVLLVVVFMLGGCNSDVKKIKLEGSITSIGEYPSTSLDWGKSYLELNNTIIIKSATHFPEEFTKGENIDIEFVGKYHKSESLMLGGDTMTTGFYYECLKIESWDFPKRGNLLYHFPQE